MSSTSPRPRRRLPPRVYWVRRLLVVAAVLLLGWLPWTLLSKDDAGPGERAATGSDQADTRQSEATPTERGDPTSRPKSAGPDKTRKADRQEPVDKLAKRARLSARPISATFGAAEAGCAPDSVQIQPSVAGAAEAGQQVLLGLTIRTTAAEACLLKVTPERVLVQVSVADRPTTIWDTAQCPGSVPTRTVALRPGWQTTLDLPWSGRLGDRGCTGLTDAAKPGTYAVQAAVVGGEPGRSVFVLSGRKASQGTPRDRSADEKPRGGQSARADRQRESPQT